MNVFTWFADWENPLHILRIIVNGAFGTPYDIGMVFYFSTILMASGLGVAIPLQAGIFNIGAEGQIVVGALASAVVGLNLPQTIPFSLGMGLCFMAAMLAAGIWGGIAGAIRAFRGGHEVISSIMLNFIASGLTGWLVISHLQAKDNQNPETASLPTGLMLERWSWFTGAPVTHAFWLALFVIVLFWFVLRFTKIGFAIKAVKQSPDAARTAGLNVAWIRFWTFAAGSAACGLAGATMVLGEAGRFRVEMGEGFGFLGIPVALLVGGRPLALILSAFLFASLHHGASLLDIESTKVSRDLAQVIEALIVLCVVVQTSYMARRKSRRSSP